MPVSLKLDDTTGDLYYKDGKFQLINQKQDISRHQLILRFNINRGTWFKDITLGLPLLKNENNPTQILGAVPKEVFDSYIKDEVLKCEFITEITEYVSILNKANRAISVSITAITEDGEVSFADVDISL